MESPGGCRVSTGVGALGAGFLRITPGNDFEAFQKTQAAVQGTGKVRSSDCKSLVLNKRQLICIQNAEDFGVIHASSDVKFRKIAGAGNRAAKLSVVAGEGFSQPAADAGKNVRGIEQHLGDSGVEGVKQASKERTLWSERVIV